jgi:Virulence factor BrkB
MFRIWSSVPTLDIRLGEEISRITAKSEGKLTFGFLLGLAIALWSANAGMKAIFDVLNIIYDEDEKRSLIWLNVVSLFFTICAIAGIGLAIALVVGFPLLLAAFGLASFDHPIIGYLRWPVMFFMDRVAAWRNGVGSVSAASSPASLGLRCPRCSPGTSEISPITTLPTERSARWSA